MLFNFLDLKEIIHKFKQYKYNWSSSFKKIMFHTIIICKLLANDGHSEYSIHPSL